MIVSPTSNNSPYQYSSIDYSSGMTDQVAPIASAAGFNYYEPPYGGMGTGMGAGMGMDPMRSMMGGGMMGGGMMGGGMMGGGMMGGGMMGGGMMGGGMMGGDMMMKMMNIIQMLMGMLQQQQSAMNGGYNPGVSNITESSSPRDFQENFDTIGDDPYQADGSQKFDSFSSFETEGNNPNRGHGSEHFDAFESSVVTPNGNGIRNENKIPKEDRVAMDNTNEHFSATVTPEISSGSQAIITQWHGEGEGALVKLYVDDQAADVQVSGAENGVAGDGIFDVYMVHHDPKTGDPIRTNLGTTTSGRPMNIDIVKTGNEYSANVNGHSAHFTAPDDEEVYLKYGMYLQTKDPLTGERAKPNEGGMDILARNGITEASATFAGVNYTREIV